LAAQPARQSGDWRRRPAQRADVIAVGDNAREAIHLPGPEDVGVLDPLCDVLSKLADAIGPDGEAALARSPVALA